MILSPEQLKENTIILYNRVDDFIKKEYYKHFEGFTVAEGFLVIDIGDNKSIHINPKIGSIILVDKKTYHNENFLTEESVATLNRLIDEAKMASGSYRLYRSGLAQYFDSLLSRKMGNSIAMYQEAEIFTYKMYLTFYISQTCLNRKGAYKFKLSDGSFLHLTNIYRYWVDDGDYCLETGGSGIKVFYFEGHRSNLILNAIKELCKDPENLKNLAKV